MEPNDLNIYCSEPLEEHVFETRLMVKEMIMMFNIFYFFQLWWPSCAGERTVFGRGPAREHPHEIILKCSLGLGTEIV